MFLNMQGNIFGLLAKVYILAFILSPFFKVRFRTSLSCVFAPCNSFNYYPALGTITMKDGGGYYTVSIPGIYEGLYPGETDVEIEANDQDGATYSYIAEAAGTFVVTVNGFSYYDAAADAWVEC